MSLRKSRRLQLEGLETRQLLAAEGFHNFLAPLDVNDDGQVTPVDALTIINHINRAVQERIDDATAVRDRFLDVNDDSRVTPIDALQIINRLNRGAERVVDRVFAQLSNADGARIRAEFVRESGNLRESVGGEIRDRFEVRLQNGVPGREYPVLVDGGIVGNVVANSVGRGVLEIVSESLEHRPLLEEISQRVRDAVRGGLVHVDGVGGVVLGAEGESVLGADPDSGSTSSDQTIRVPDFGMLPRLRDISGPVYSTSLRAGNSVVGAAYATGLENGLSLGVVARGFEPGATYDLSVDGTVLFSVTAGRFGVVSLIYDSTAADAMPTLNPLPEIDNGSVITISGRSRTVSGTFDFLELPFLSRPADQPGNGNGIIDRIERTLVAPLSGNRVDGLVTFTPRGEGYYLGIALRGAGRSQSYNVKIDGVQVATFRSNMLGWIVDRRVSSGPAADGFPTVRVGSVVEIEGLARASFITAESGIRDLLG